MKSVFLSILCSILFTSFCFTMEKTNSNLKKNLPTSTSEEKLAGWDILDDDIQPAQEMQNPQTNTNSLGWFPIINAVRKSFHKKPSPTIETSHKIEPLVHVRKPKLETVSLSIATSPVIIDTQHSLETTIDNSIPSIIEQQDVAVTAIHTILSVKKSPSCEKLNLHDNSHDFTNLDQSGIIAQGTLAIVSPLQPKQTNLHGYDNDSHSNNSIKTNSSTISHNNSIQAMSIDRDSTPSSTELQTEKTTSFFTMFQKGCCNCFDVFHDLESKKKSSKS